MALLLEFFVSTFTTLCNFIQKFVKTLMCFLFYYFTANFETKIQITISNMADDFSSSTKIKYGISPVPSSKHMTFHKFSLKFSDSLKSSKFNTVFFQQSFSTLKTLKTTLNQYFPTRKRNLHCKINYSGSTFPEKEKLNPSPRLGKLPGSGHCTLVNFFQISKTTPTNLHNSTTLNLKIFLYSREKMGVTHRTRQGKTINYPSLVGFGEVTFPLYKSIPSEVQCETKLEHTVVTSFSGEEEEARLLELLDTEPG